MSMNFGKGNRSIAFNPTSAFPLDARSYFESYSDAVAAAAKAEAAGSTSTEYYFGQTLVVVENNKATFYIIQPDKTLSSVSVGESSSALEINANQFEFDENGTLILKGASDAAPGSFVSVDENGVLTWIAPIDAYTKEETEELVNQKVANAAHLKRKILADVNEIKAYMAANEDAEQYIFMVPTGLEEDSDKYDEYMVIALTDSEGVVTKYVEKVGSWEVDLADYAKTSDVNNALDNKVDKEEDARLITNAEAEKLAALLLGAERNVINSVSNDFTVDENRQLILNDIPVSKVTDLQDLLNGKVDAREGYSLISSTDKAKLDALTLGEDNNLEISGKVNAANVEGLAEWIEENAATTTGLSQNNLDDVLYTKLVSSLLIKSIDTTQLNVTNGKLSVIAVDSSLITGLEDALNTRATTESVSTLNTKVDDLSTELNNLTTTVSDHTLLIGTLSDRLTWKSI